MNTLGSNGKQYIQHRVDRVQPLHPLDKTVNTQQSVDSGQSTFDQVKKAPVHYKSRVLKSLAFLHIS